MFYHYILDRYLLSSWSSLMILSVKVIGGLAFTWSKYQLILWPNFVFIWTDDLRLYDLSREVNPHLAKRNII